MKLLVFLISAAASSSCNSAGNPAPTPTGDQREPGAAPGRATDSEPTAPVARVRFASSLAEAEEGTFADSFRLLAQRDIVTKFEVPAAALGTDTVLLHFELLNPEGVVHASKWYAVSSEAEFGATIKHPAFDREVPVQRAEIQSGLAAFYGKIPVAGTNFTRSRLHGEFTATLSLGVAAATPIAEHSFVMEL